MHRSISHPAENLTLRAGVTLTEVLMSLMIMSIGVSAVAVLFPISTLRSIQANRLTHGAILKYNVEGILQAEPNLIFDPDGDGNFQEHFVPVTQRNYVVDPFGYYTHYSDGNYGIASAFGNDGTNPSLLPRWGGGLQTLDGFARTSVDGERAGREFDGHRRTIDGRPEFAPRRRRRSSRRHPPYRPQIDGAALRSALG